MATCGVDDYDALPARVGKIDVDFLRWRLDLCNKPKPTGRFSKIITWFLQPATDERARRKIINELERAKLLWFEQFQNPNRKT